MFSYIKGYLQETLGLTTQIGYKKCRDGRIVRLQILGKNNRYRWDVVDENFAKFQCSDALVLDIYDPNTLEIFETARSIRDNEFIYSVNQIASSSLYGYDTSEVCAPGIHYFSNEKAAMAYDGVILMIKNENRCVEYDNNGGVLEAYTVDKDGLKDGECTRYHYNSNKFCFVCTYSKGKLNGKYISYFENGKISGVCTYVQGKTCGEDVDYYDNGKMLRKCTYKDGEMCEEIRYDYNGKMVLKQIYDKGKLISQKRF